MKDYKNPFGQLTRFDWLLYLGSLLAITLVFFIYVQKDFLTLVTSLIGVTALIFVAKGDLLGQALTVIFALFYALVSYELAYYSEMITYLGMTAPIAFLATISWLKHPSKEGNNEVAIAQVTSKAWMILIILTVFITFIFYFILQILSTPYLPIATISIATSFIASGLTYLRSPYYGIAYAANDLVLISLWLLASIQAPHFIPMVLCFIVFFINDCYGFFIWKKRQQSQNAFSK